MNVPDVRGYIYSYSFKIKKKIIDLYKIFILFMLNLSNALLKQTLTLN